MAQSDTLKLILEKMSKLEVSHEELKYEIQELKKQNTVLGGDIVNMTNKMNILTTSKASSARSAAKSKAVSSVTNEKGEFIKATEWFVYKYCNELEDLVKKVGITEDMIETAQTKAAAQKDYDKLSQLDKRSKEAMEFFNTFISKLDKKSNPVPTFNAELKQALSEAYYEAKDEYTKNNPKSEAEPQYPPAVSPAKATAKSSAKKGAAASPSASAATTAKQSSPKPSPAKPKGQSAKASAAKQKAKPVQHEPEEVDDSVENTSENNSAKNSDED